MTIAKATGTLATSMRAAETPAPPQAASTHRIGVWSALLFTLAGAVYLLGIIFAFATHQMVLPRGETIVTQPDWLQVLGAIVSFVCAPALVLMVASIHALTAGTSRMLSLSALAFSGGFASVVMVSRYVWLASVRPQLAAGTAGLEHLLLHGTGSLLLAIDILGWCLLLPLASLCLAATFAQGRLERAIRTLLIAYALLGFISAWGFAIASPPLTSALNLGNILLELATTLIAVWFRRTTL